MQCILRHNTVSVLGSCLYGELQCFFPKHNYNTTRLDDDNRSNQTKDILFIRLSYEFDYAEQTEVHQILPCLAWQGLPNGANFHKPISKVINVVNDTYWYDQTCPI